MQAYNADCLLGNTTESFNSGGHWELLCINPTKNEVLYIDPCGEKDCKVQKIAQSWRIYMRRRKHNGLDQNRPEKWRVVTTKHDTQQDYSSCGIYVLKFAEQLLMSEDLICCPANVDNYRRQIAQTLLDSSGCVKNYCRECAAATGDTNWVQCDNCHWWCHYKCTGMRCGMAAMKTKVFLCTVCKNFPPTATPERTHECIKELKDPFILVKLTTGRICQGCRTRFKKPPHGKDEIVLKHRETYYYNNKYCGKETQTTGNRYYHARANCVLKIHHSFILDDLIIPQETESFLTKKHAVELCRNGIYNNHIINKAISKS